MADKASTAFDEKHAAAYDKTFEKLAPIKDALHLLARSVLLELPGDAQVLCVGAGTGAELLYLAEVFPGWEFTALDTAAPMLEVCRRRVETAGYGPRCRFHHGVVASLDRAARFHAATCILVSQFLTAQDQRRELFGEIRARLLPGGLLVSADLACDMADPKSSGILEVWRRTLAYSGLPDHQVQGAMDAYRRAVAVLPASDVERLIAEAGFDDPTQFFQAGLIHAWYALREPPS
jgi:tRNA (cmo5U34)-methyltransferase